MELISEEKDSAPPQPVLTIKRGAGKMQWQDFVDRDMGTFRGPRAGPDSPGCKTLGGGFRPKRSGSIGPQGRGKPRCPADTRDTRSSCAPRPAPEAVG